MDFQWSNRISAVQPSAIREILKVTADPSVISFAAGSPSPESFPVTELAAVAEELFAHRASFVLQYGLSEGYPPLRDALKDRMTRRLSSMRDYDDLIVVSGGQQGIDLTAKCLLNEGDVVLCEAPSFIGALNSLKSYGAILKPVTCDDDGMIPEALEEAISANSRVKLIYTIPTFQNPSGCVLPEARRRQIVEIAERHNLIILEDDPYRELSYGAKPPLPVKSFDTDGRVIYVGSFSKTIAPGIRLGFICAHRDMILKLTTAKQTQDVHTNLFFQVAATELLTNHDFDAHIADCCEIYIEKRDRMCAGLTAAFEDRVRWQKPQGGLFIWCKLPENIDGYEFCQNAGRKKVAGVPGSAFMLNGEPTPSIRLNFSLPTLAQIDEGCARLGETLDEMLK